jgi:hypothetical protein
MASERKLDIFRVLEAINDKDVGFLDKLTEEEAKAFVPFVVQRWLSGTPSAKQVFFINELLNPFVFSLQGHKKLLWDLMTICSPGKQQRYAWNALPSKKNTSKPTAVKVLQEYYGYSSTDAVNVLDLLSRQNLLDMAEELGWQNDEIAKIKKEVKETPEEAKHKPPPKTKKSIEF